MEAKDLTLKEKIGQMIMIGIGRKEDIPCVINMIKQTYIGGVLLYKNNYDNYQEMLQLIKKLHKANKNNKIPLFIAIDQEGGIVNRMPNEFLNIYSANKLGLTNDEVLVRDAAKITSKMLYDTGINLNFAPVLDLQNKGNRGLGNRCFSDNYEKVSQLSSIYAKELNSNNIISVRKHFPGHGSTKTDSHFFLPIVKNYNSFDDDLYPFKKTIIDNCDAIMISHILIKDIDKRYPCSLSKTFIMEKLRKDLNYDGVVLTDDIRMYGIRILYGKYKPIIKALCAGNDIVLIKYKNNDINIINKLLSFVKDEELINKSVNRILKLKEKYMLNDNNFNGCNIDEINKKIKSINDKIKSILKI